MAFHLYGYLKLMTAAINRTDQRIPWPVFARQLESQQLCGAFLHKCLVAVGTGADTEILGVISSPCIAPTGGYDMPQHRHGGQGRGRDSLGGRSWWDWTFFPGGEVQKIRNLFVTNQWKISYF